MFVRTMLIAAALATGAGNALAQSSGYARGWIEIQDRWQQAAWVTAAHTQFALYCEEITAAEFDVIRAQADAEFRSISVRQIGEQVKARWEAGLAAAQRGENPETCRLSDPRQVAYIRVIAQGRAAVLP